MCELAQELAAPRAFRRTLDPVLTKLAKAPLRFPTGQPVTSAFDALQDKAHWPCGVRDRWFRLRMGHAPLFPRSAA